ncbi:MAG TPA: diguanylate cyclase [Magnetovibrio sp.]
MDINNNTTLLTLLSAALERTSDGYVRVDSTGTIRATNPAMETLFGYTQEALAKMTITELFVDHEQALDERNLTRQVFTAPYDRTHAYTLSALHRDGSRFTAEIRFAGADASSGHSQWLVQDISDQLELNRLRLSEERYKSSQTFAGIGTWDWHVATEELHWSDAVAPMFGLPPGTKPSYSLFCQAVHPDDRKRVRENEIACELHNQKHDVEYRVVWPDGTVRWLRETGNLLRDEDGTIKRMIGVVRDISEQKETEQRYQHMAYHDPLTGLPNRGLFEQRLTMALQRSQRHGDATALIFVDLGKFKAINDTFGHTVGDKVLVEVGERLKASVRLTDTVARIGGDEFVVVMEGVHTEDEVSNFGQKLIHTITQPMTIDGHDHTIGVSVGASLSTPSDSATTDNAASLIHRADMAMYAAKAESGNHFKLAEMD